LTHHCHKCMVFYKELQYITVLLLVKLRLQYVHTLFRQYHDKSGIEIRYIIIT